MQNIDVEGVPHGASLMFSLDSIGIKQGTGGVDEMCSEWVLSSNHPLHRQHQTWQCLMWHMQQHGCRRLYYSCHFWTGLAMLQM